jgi:ureidoacrylate peracid hydrolase
MRDGIAIDALLEPKRAALLIVDVQNDFCHADGVFGRSGLDLSRVAQMAAAIRGLHAAAAAAGVPRIFLQTIHSAATDSAVWTRRGAFSGDICREGAFGADFFELRPSDDDIIIRKHRYSGFIGTTLEHVLRTFARTTVVATGTATNICVESTVRDGYMLDHDMIVVEDAVSAPDMGLHESALENVRRYFGWVLSSDEVIAAWRPASRLRAAGSLGTTPLAMDA